MKIGICTALSWIVPLVLVPATAFAQASVPHRVQSFPLRDVRLGDGVFRAAMERNGRYLLELEPDRLLHAFRANAGLDPKGDSYGGWERDTIAGHSLGHYLRAVALQYAATGEEAFRERADYVVAELRACQEAGGDGFVFGFPRGREIFAELRNGAITSHAFNLNGCWVPFYNLHKTFAGLVEAHRQCGSEQALLVATDLADFLVALFAELDDAQMQSILDTEHGGINESFADLYALTGEEEYLALAERLFHHAVLDPLAAREDRLDGLHGNTQIPKVLGCARLYELTGKEEYRTIAEFFWRTVVEHHTYVNGGHGDSEYFGPPDLLSRRLGDTTETCNTYNMLRLTRYLFRWEPRAEYFAYYERALYNHILAHQHPETGMFVYKGLVDMPARKGFSSPFDSFWCCVGTGMENHAKYGESIFFHDGESLFVNLYVSSRLDWRDRGVTVELTTSLPYARTTTMAVLGEEGGIYSGLPLLGGATLRLGMEEPVALAIHLRVPTWLSGGMVVTVNGDPVATTSRGDGYATIERTWSDGDEISLEMPMDLRFETMPDDPKRVAFFIGPTLLCVDLGDDDPVPFLVCPREELLARIPHVEGDGITLLFPDDHLSFRTEGIGKPGDVVLRPHFAVHESRYTVYVDALTEAQWDARQREAAEEEEHRADLRRRTVDEVRLGVRESEREHALASSERSYAGTYQGRRWRDARDGGFIAFDLKVLPDAPMELMCTYWGGDRRRTFDVLVDDEVIATQVLNRLAEGEFVDVTYAVPETLTTGKETVRVTLRGRDVSHVGRVFGCRSVRR